MKKAQLVFVPYPGVGHLASTIHFANLLINHNPHLSITVLVIKLPFQSHTPNQTVSLASSSNRMQIIDLPHSHHSQDEAVGSLGTSMLPLIENQKPLVRQAVSDLMRNDHSAPPVAALIVDMFCTSMIDVAKEFNVPALVYFTSSVAFLGLILHLHTLREQDNVTATELLEGSHTELVIPSFANSVPTRVLPAMVLSEEMNSVFTMYGSGLKRADGIIVNSFEELESHAVHSFSDVALPLYPVGPILNLKLESTWDDSDIVKWLNDQPLTSVVFLCFGSKGSFDEDQVREIACALETSGARFLWSLRKPSPKGSIAPPSDYTLTVTELGDVLPQGFLDRTSKIGRVIGWAPQAQVLAHNAIGGFVSHCGWNSILESIYFGVPIATWPLYAEQQPNAFELVHELNLAVEIALDYRKEPNGVSNYLLSAEKIEKGIRSVLEQDGETRKKVKEMSEISRKTLMEGGCSHSHLERLMDYISNQT